MAKRKFKFRDNDEADEAAEDLQEKDLGPPKVELADILLQQGHHDLQLQRWIRYIYRGRF